MSLQPVAVEDEEAVVGYIVVVLGVIGLRATAAAQQHSTINLGAGVAR